MGAAKAPKALILIAILALGGALVVAGCGGAGGTTSSNQSPAPNEAEGGFQPEIETGAEAGKGEAEEGGTEKAEGGTAAGGGAEAEGGAEEAEGEGGGAGEAEGTEEGGETAGGGAAMTEGKTIFTSNCGTCHTLAAAGTSGNIGPNLDELKPSESIVENQVINGGGPMPAFGKENILDEGEVKAVSEYVAAVAGE